MLHIIHTHTELAVDFLLHLRRARPVAFVGNRNVPPTLLRALFGSQVVHVKAPPSDAYQTLDSLHAELLHVLEGGKGGGGGGPRVRHARRRLDACPSSSRHKF